SSSSSSSSSIPSSSSSSPDPSSKKDKKKGFFGFGSKKAPKTAAPKVKQLSAKERRIQGSFGASDLESFLQF
ncbi:MAG: hypothetical protein Q8P67_27480, partial [archaeon]|nr:hypothetical protein [archaeon]